MTGPKRPYPPCLCQEELQASSALLDIQDLPYKSQQPAVFSDTCGHRITFKSNHAVAIGHPFHRAASAHDRSSHDYKVSLRCAVLAVVGLSLLGWAILLILIFRSFPHF